MSVVIATGYADAADAVQSAREAGHRAAAGLGGAPCDLAVVFLGAATIARADEVLAGIGDALDPAELVGSVAGGLLHDGQELDSPSGVSVWAASLGEEGTADVFELRTEEVEGGLALSGLPETEAGEASAVVLLVDPTQLPVEGVLRAFEEHLPGVPVIGGLTSSLPVDGRGLLRGRDRSDAAAIGVRLSGVEVLPCVAQGARPIGPELAVTAGHGGVIEELAGRKAIEALREAVEGLEADERERLGNGLLLGLVVGPARPDYDAGDFIVRGLAGADPSVGAIVVGAPVEVGQVARLHVRDPPAATRDLEDALRLRRVAVGDGRIAGALAFTCNGRGRPMFGYDHHDTDAIQRELGPLPVAGMVAAGEIGPVGGRPFLHSYTATVAVFVG